MVEVVTETVLVTVIEAVTMFVLVDTLVIVDVDVAVDVTVPGRMVEVVVADTVLVVTTVGVEAVRVVLRLRCELLEH